MLRIERDFLTYSDGIPGKYSVSVSNIHDRLDVKYCLSGNGAKVPHWNALGLKVIKLGNVLKRMKDRGERVEEDETYQLLQVTYGGEVVEGELKDGSELSYSKLFRVKEWDVLLSNMGVGRGAVGIVPSFHNGRWVSNEYTILRASSKEEAIYYVTLLRTKEILADILAFGTGMNRGRIKWSDVSSIEVPEYNGNVYKKELRPVDFEDFWKAYSRITEIRGSQKAMLADRLKLEDEEAELRWLAHKPPE